MNEIITKTNGTQNSNGAHPIASESTHWRDEVLQQCLAGFENEQNIDALLAAVRQHCRQSATILVSVNRISLQAFLQAETKELQEVVARSETYQMGVPNRFLPFLGWFSAIWSDMPFEVAYSPNWDVSGVVVFIGKDPVVLRQLVAAAVEYTVQQRSRTSLYASGWRDAPAIDVEIDKVSWSDIVLPAELLTQIREAVEGWAESASIYREMGFAWRRGILMIGPPGTGKTMITKAIARSLPEFPVLYVRDLRERNSRDSIAAIFQRARQLKRSIVCIEDIDTLVNEGNRSIFLNELDGFADNEGMLLVASTNHPHKIDEAFLKRPSRFDRVFHIGLPAEAERAEFCRRILARSVFAARFAPDFDAEAMIARVVEKSKGFTPAYLKEALTGAALSLAHRGEAGVLSERYADAVLEQVDELKKTMRRLKDPSALAELTTGETSIGLRQ